jgi:hypothetical protein
MILLDFMEESFGDATIFVICIGLMLYAVIVQKLFEGWEAGLDTNNRFLGTIYCILAIYSYLSFFMAYLDRGY